LVGALDGTALAFAVFDFARVAGRFTIVSRAPDVRLLLGTGQ
jgi:hypothetical protein